MRFTAAIVLSLLSINSFSQSLLLQVVDKNQKPLSYCSVMWNKSFGLVTDEKGEVLIENVQQIKDSIVLNMIGYKAKTLYSNEIFGKANIQIVLEEEYILLPEIKVGEKKFITVGCIDKKEGYSYLANLNHSTMQVAFFIDDYEKNSVLNACSVFIAKKSDEKVPFRFRFYSNNNGLPGNDLLQKNLIVYNYKSNAWCSFQLNNMSFVVPDNGFFIAIECLVTNELKDYNLGIGQTDALKNENTFIKFGYTEWQKFSHASPNNKNPTNIMVQAKLSN